MLKKIAVLVSGGGTNLQALIDAQARGELGQGKIVTVIASKEGVYALERAERAGIEAFALPRRDYPDAKAYTKALTEALTEREIDLVVLAGFLTILDEVIYERFPNRIINVHPALIPSFAGQGYYGLTLLNHLTSSQVATVALSTYTTFRLASEYRTDLNSLNTSSFDSFASCLANLFA